MAVVGIDLGTTNTVVASVRGGRVNVLPDEQGRRLLPSVVSFHPGGEVLVGYPAKERRVVDARNTISSIKRLIGRSWESDELRRARQRFPFELKEGPGQGPLVVARSQEYTLPEISAFVLRRAKQIADRALGEVVDRAVITVPANFNELQRAATKVAGRVAGLEVLRIINEPTAAALAYGLGRTSKERIAVYDFGGGTFDCTLLDLSGNVFEVLATAGDTFLGGDDIDLAIADRMADAFLRAHRYDPRSDPQAFERLRISAEILKHELSTKERASARLREVAFGVGGVHLDLDFGMTRGELETIAAPFVERTFSVCQEALAIARLPVAGFDKIILVGGSTRIPLVRHRVEQFFGAPPLDRVNPEEVVGIGAAIQAAALTEVARRRSIPPAPSPRKSRPPIDDDSKEDVATVAVKLSTLLEQERARASQPAPGEVARTTARMGLPPPVPARASRTSVTDVTLGPTGTQPLPAQPDMPAPASKPLVFEDRLRAERESTEQTRPTDVLARASQSQREPARTVPLRTPPPPGLPIAPVPAPTPPPPPAPPPSALAPTTPSAFGLPIVGVRAPQPTGPMATTRGLTPAPPPPPAAPPTPPPPAPITVPPPSPSATPQPPSPMARTTPMTSRPPPAVRPVLVDVTPRALVVETAGGWCDVIVPRNAKIPCERTRAFSTSTDLQTVVRVRVGQGEDPVFGQNTLLGEIELSSLRPAPRGEVTIQLRFEVDEGGTLQVSATDLASGREARATLQLVGIAGASSIASMLARQAAMRVQ